jgi:hypothetical protein
MSLIKLKVGKFNNCLLTVEGNETNVSALLLLQSVQQIAINIKALPSARSLPSKIVQPLVALATACKPGKFIAQRS